MRAEGVAWRIRSDLAGTCSLCRGMIPTDEPFLGGKEGGAPTGEVCLTCVCTAVRGILPGNPRLVVVELDSVYTFDNPRVRRFRLEVDGHDLGTASVDTAIPHGQQAPALLTLVCSALETRRQQQGTPDARYMTMGDGWAMLPAPADEWLIVWVRGPKTEPDRDDGDGGEEFWTPGILLTTCGRICKGEGHRCDLLAGHDARHEGLGGAVSWTEADSDGGEPLPVWHFTYKREPFPDLEVLAWKRGPERPRYMEGAA